MSQTFARQDLVRLACDLLTKGGMAAAKAEVVAELLVQTDEMGVSTHGISMIPYYLPELANGNMPADGMYDVVRDTGATQVWDGNYLPGHWLMSQALGGLEERARTYGTASLAIRRSHHVGCLSTHTRVIAERGLICLMMTSDPWGKWVAPYGGTEPVLTPNPWAVGYPADGHPVLIDTCASITTVSKVREHINNGTQFAHPWMLDGAGNPTTDPTVVNQTPKGSILPVGGADHGHKGYALGLMVEMLTQGLSGHGRAAGADRWGGNVFVQVMDPEAFGGLVPFTTEVSYLNDQCRASPPAAGHDAVRVPGDRAYERMSRSAKGVFVPDEVWTRISASAASSGIALPVALG